MMKGRIVKQISNDYTVLANQKLYVCKSRGLFRNLNITPLVGDNVNFDDINNYIMEVLPRKNSLVRPPVANIDQTVVITSVKEPEFSTNLLDKLLVIIEYNNIEPVICFTKLDLLAKEEVSNIDTNIAYYRKIGYQVFPSNDIEPLKKIFKDKISVFTGQSGAGKSTLINKLNPNLSLKTDRISKALGRGKHTTRHVELIPLFDGLVADTPGFSAVTFDEMSISDIRDSFIEFNLYRHECQYKDCMHNNEINCAIKKRVEDNTILKSRYENYLKFISK